MQETKTSLLLTLLLLAVVINMAAGCEYRKYSPEHTMCKYQRPGCNMTQHFNLEDSELIVKTHNELRNKVATAVDGPAKASNMKELVWDCELAAIAQRWVEQCKLQHDEERRSHLYSTVGQNMYQSWEIPMKPMTTTEFKEAIEEAWYQKEVDNVTEKDVDLFSEDNARFIGHLSQVVWADTEAIGCAYADYEEFDTELNQMKIFHLICCNYGPSGNVVNGKIYVRGVPCSNCSSGCSEIYKGLCKTTIQKAQTINATDDNEEYQSEDGDDDGEQVEGTDDIDGEILEGTDDTDGEILEGTVDTDDNVLGGTDDTEGEILEGTDDTDGATLKGTDDTDDGVLEGTDDTDDGVLEGTDDSDDGVLEGTDDTDDGVLEGTDDNSESEIEEGTDGKEDGAEEDRNRLEKNSEKRGTETV